MLYRRQNPTPDNTCDSPCSPPQVVVGARAQMIQPADLEDWPLTKLHHWWCSPRTDPVDWDWLRRLPETRPMGPYHDLDNTTTPNRTSDLAPAKVQWHSRRSKWRSACTISRQKMQYTQPYPMQRTKPKMLKLLKSTFSQSWIHPMEQKAGSRSWSHSEDCHLRAWHHLPPPTSRIRASWLPSHISPCCHGSEGSQSCPGPQHHQSSVHTHSHHLPQDSSLLPQPSRCSQDLPGKLWQFWGLGKRADHRVAWCNPGQQGTYISWGCQCYQKAFKKKGKNY